jgi:tripartite-type tricarboxylate transporter receptor subunit TctC
VTKDVIDAKRRGLVGFGGSALLSAVLPSTVFAQPYPSKSIRLIVPSPPGGGSDTNARNVAAQMSVLLGQPIVIENKPGASGVISDMMVVQAKPDGYTILYEIFSFGVNPALRQLPFDPVKDLIPVSQVLNMTNILVVPSSAPYQNLNEFLAYARAHPGQLTFASYGNGGTAHLAGEMLARDAGIQWLHVPYKGGAPAVADLLAGQVSAYFSNPVSGLPHIQSGRFRALGVTSKERLSSLPDIPTFTELGFKDFEVLEWNGMFVPAKTPPEIVDRLYRAIAQSLQEPSVRQRMLKAGIEPVGNTPAQFAEFLQGQFERWTKLVKTNGIKLE